jgi:hypothetical protein
VWFGTNLPTFLSTLKMKAAGPDAASVNSYPTAGVTFQKAVFFIVSP